MKKDVRNLVLDLFNDKGLLASIGFTEEESEILYDLIHGTPISKISEKLDLPYRTIANIKNRRLHLIPIFIRRKLNHLTKFDLSKINTKLLELDALVGEYIDLFEKIQIYKIQELNLSKRVVNSLIAFNIKDTNDLKSYSRKELLDVKNIGLNAIQEIETELSKLNIQLRI